METYKDTCERCGEFRTGSRRMMIYRWYERFPNSPIVNEFLCLNCQRVMRAYAVIGFSLLFVLLVTLIGVVVWIRITT